MDEVQDTTSNNAGCPQAGIANEDCLSLNVFTPQVKINPIKIYLYFFLSWFNFYIKLPSVSTTPLPVMVWIHGGAFSLGQALEYLPNRYMEHDIVLVAIQYRLGPLGAKNFTLIYLTYLKNSLSFFPQRIPLL